MRKVWVIVVGAGEGSRFGGQKQYETLGDGTVLSQSVAGAWAVADGVVVVVPEKRREADSLAFSHATVVSGGATRSASVRAGLAAVPDDATHILVHDGARPLASDQLYRDVVAALADGAEAVVPVVGLPDTICDADGNWVDRSSLRAVQTPQGFTAERLRSAHADDPESTDDISLVRAAGGTVVVVEGSARNRKITDPDDLVAARALFHP